MVNHNNKPPSKATVIFYAVGHCVCAGSLSVINKWALQHYPYAFALTFLQLFASVIFIFALARFGLISWEPLSLTKMKRYLPAAAMFFVTLVGSNKVIGDTDVNTFVVVRSTIPIFCVFLEMFVMDIPAPPKTSFLMLVLLVAGVVIYVQSNYLMVVTGVKWIVIYVIAMPIDAVLIKQALNDVKLPPWSMAFYNNFLAMLAMPVAAVCAGEFTVFYPSTYTAIFENGAALPILVCCFAGLGISFFQMNVRHAITATAFMMLGVLNKLLTLLLNKVLLQGQTTILGLFGILLALFSCVGWQCVMQDRVLTPHKPVRPPSRENSNDREMDSSMESSPITGSTRYQNINRYTSTIKPPQKQSKPFEKCFIRFKFKIYKCYKLFLVPQILYFV